MESKEHLINIGTVKVGRKITIKFEDYSLRQIELKNLSSSCGCSKPSLKTGIIVVEYTPKAIPKHLILQGWYSTTKTIIVSYEDGTRDFLKFKAKVEK